MRDNRGLTCLHHAASFICRWSPRNWASVDELLGLAAEVDAVSELVLAPYESGANICLSLVRRCQGIDGAMMILEHPSLSTEDAVSLVTMEDKEGVTMFDAAVKPEHVRLSLSVRGGYVIPAELLWRRDPKTGKTKIQQEIALGENMC
jgi:hypothetical protein